MTPCVTILWIFRKFYQNTTEWFRFEKVSKICIFGIILQDRCTPKAWARRQSGSSSRTEPLRTRPLIGGHAQGGLLWRPTGFPSKTRILAATVSPSHCTRFPFMVVFEGQSLRKKSADGNAVGREHSQWDREHRSAHVGPCLPQLWAKNRSLHW